MAADTPVGKLPLGKTIAGAYGSLAGNLGTALRISWVWLLLLTVVAYLAGQMQFSFIGDIKNPGSAMAEMSRHAARMQASSLVHSFIYVIAGSAVAVPWHRFLLLKENPGVSGANVADGTVWRYAGNSVLIVFVAILAIMPAVVLLALLAGSPVGMFMVLIAAYVAAAFVGLRLWLVLPARAVGRNDLRLMDIWQGTRGNVWRLFWGLVVCTVPGILIMQAVMFAAGLVPGPGLQPGDAAALAAYVDRMQSGFPFVMAVLTPVGVVLGFLMIGFMSYAFRHLFGAAEGRNPY